MGRKDWETYFSALKKQDWESAKISLHQLLQEDRNNPQLYLKIGDICQRTGDTSNAVASYLAAGRILDAQGFSQKALAAFKIILRLEPDNREVISRAQKIMDDIEGAKTARLKPAGIVERPDPDIALTPPVAEAPEPPALAPSPRQAEGTPASSWLESTSLTETPSEGGTISVPPASPPSGKEKPEDDRPPASADGTGGDEEEWLKSAFDAIDKSVTKERPEAALQRDLSLQCKDTSRVPFGETPQITGPPGSPDDLPESLPHEMQDLIRPLSDRPGIPPKPAIFADLPDGVFREFISGLDARTFSHGQTIIEEGDSGDTMYLISSGKARVVAHLLGREVELAVLEEGDLFGEVGFLTGRPRTASVTAEGSLGVFEISRLNIERIIEMNPEVLARLEEFYEGRVIDTIKKIRP